MAPPDDETQPETTGQPMPQPGLPTITPPTGGGAIRGIGEKFAANPVTGTGAFTVPLAVSPGRSGFTPALTLSYNSGEGNGPFGLGWSVSTPNITRRTDQGLPRYADEEESDVFLISGAEDLVSVLADNGTRVVDRTTWPGWTVRPYRPRTEGLFARIERWTSDDTGETHWRSISRDNITTRYGVTADSRVADGDRIYSWLICESWDSLGNATVYDYAAENAAGVDISAGSERTRTRGAARYLTRVRYGNRVSRLVQPNLSAMEWMFEVIFDYGESRLLEQPLDPGTPPGSQLERILAAPDPATGWALRPDPFSRYRAGFEVRTHRRCHRVLMFHRFAELGDEPCLVRSTDLSYNDIADAASASVDGELDHAGSTRFASMLRSVTQSGYVQDPDMPIQLKDGVRYTQYVRKSLPPLEFDYSSGSFHEQSGEVDPDSVENLPIGLDGRTYQWVDLDREGISGILTGQGDTWYYKPNLGEGRFGPLAALPTRPSNTSLISGQLLDLAGDGRLSAVELGGPNPGFATRTEDGGWEPYRSFDYLPTIAWDDPNLRFTDLDNDGRTDILLTGDDTFTWYGSLGQAGFGPAHSTAEPPGEGNSIRLVFASGEQAVYLADMAGDGRPDLVRIRNGKVCYWPNLGYGRFGAEVVMDNSPWFDRPGQFDQSGIRLADFHGSGTTDILYLGADGARLYLNQSGNRLTDARPLRGLPQTQNPIAVQAADLFGSGTACLVWSSLLPGDASRPMRYLNLIAAGRKPFLLNRMVNNLGAETELEYASSTSFYLADRKAGQPWITRLPFPVHVLTRVTTRDRISRNEFVTRYAYHHGYYDGIEREFRGFGMVEQWDAQEIAAAATDLPPVRTKTWFHTGYYAGRDHISNYYAGLLDASDIGEYYRDAGLSDEEAGILLLADTVLPDGLTPDEEREACRALRGSMLRQEVYADDGTPQAPHPYTVTEQDLTVDVLQGRGPNRHAVFFTHPREAISYQYERNPADPRTTHTLTLHVDQFGNVLRSASIGYGRRSPDFVLPAADQVVQAQTLVTLVENDVTNAVDSADDHRNPLPAETRTYELTGLAPASGRISFGELEAAAANAAPIDYEQVPTLGRLQKRLIEHIRTLYRRDDLGGPLPLGTIQARGLGFQTHRLSLTPGLVTLIYSDRVDADLLAEAGYVHSEGDPGWWQPSGTLYYSAEPTASSPDELAVALAHFFLPQRFRTPFHSAAASTESFARYDKYDLLVEETRDALGNRVTAGERDTDPEQPLVRVGLDYRVLQPGLVMDPNRNRSAIAFDALGLVVGTALMGKLETVPAEGDLLAKTFRADLPEDEIRQLLSNPDGPTAAALLDQATTRIVYDVHAYQRSRDVATASPAAAAVLARENHVSDPSPSGGHAIQVSLGYSDGLGREVQHKAQAEPTVDSANPRWVGSGWTVFNNKGKPVRQFEPFFTNTPAFESDATAGVSPILFYDPLQRVVGTLHADHTWEKVTFDPWRNETWDGSDTVGIADPAGDPDVGAFFARLPVADYLPTWAALQTSPSQDRAAAKAAIHAATPTVSHTDSLGRSRLVVAHNRAAYSDAAAGAAPTEEFHFTRSELDLEGNQRALTDALGRVVVRYDYDLLGDRIRSSSMDAGQRWTLNDVTGAHLCTWDSRDHRVRTGYDVLRRATELFLRTGSAAEQTVSRTVYGEARGAAEAGNLRGRAVQMFDQAGVATTDLYDFKGNLLRSGRQLAAVYDRTLDWSGTVPLEAETFTGSTRYDALNRVAQMVAPHSDQPGTVVAVVQYAYDMANQLYQVDAWLELAAEPSGSLDRATATLHAVTSIGHDAKGRRTQISYGDGTSTEYVYHPLTFRLAQLTTGQLQDTRYTYDPVGNLTEVRDSALQTVFFRNQRVDPNADYTYDSVYRLIEATGREHLGQVGGAPIPHSYNDGGRVGLLHPADGNALGRYLERYTYDAVGNFATMRHIGSDPAAPGWTRTYAYAEPNQVDPTTRSNRLTSSTVAQTVESYSYDRHGSTLTMPQLQEMRWDFRDQLQLTRRQAVNAGDADGVAHAGERTWYVYDATGQRIRKVTESAPGQVKDEHIYLGGFEVSYHRGATPRTQETLHLMDDQQRIALIETTTDGVAPRRVVRYQLANHVGSVSLEIDDAGGLISFEEYTPFGSTSYQALKGVRSKAYRNTGKERDEESGLNYHGRRYYAPWLGRWASFDPSGIDDGPNGYEFVRGNPVNLVDPDGRSWKSFLGGVAVGIGSALLVTAVIATAPISASVALGAAAVGVVATGYTLVQSARQRDVFNRPISRDQAHFQAGTLFGGLFAGAAAGPISGALSSIGPSAMTSAGISVGAGAAVSPAAVGIASAITAAGVPSLTAMMSSSGEGGGPRETSDSRATETPGPADSPKPPTSASKPVGLIKQAEEAGLRDVIEGEVDIFVHGTTKAPAAAMVESQGANLSTSGGKFGGKLFTVPNADVAKVFASRSASNVAGGEEALVGISLPRSVAAQLKAEKLLVPGPISSPPPGVPASTQEWVFKPGSLETLSKEGFFFQVKF